MTPSLVPALALFGGLLAPTGIGVDPPSLRLDGPGSSAQLVVTGRGPDGRVLDATHDPRTRFESLDPGVAVVDASGAVRPVGDGTTTVRVTSAAGAADVPVRVTGADGRRPVRFVGEVVPIFSKLGCNAGACHGRSSGQNGFRLSLLGADPRLDFESLAREGRGRRVFPAAPGLSLLLCKPSARLPHGGGKRLEVGSPEYQTLARWIAQGMPFVPDGEPPLTRLEVRPAGRVVAAGRTQQFRVVAHHGDGSEADVTRLTDFSSTAPDLATVDARGRARAREGVGVAAVVARFGGLVAPARLTVPSARPAPSWEEPRASNLVDRHVFDHLKALGLPPPLPCDDATFARRSSLDLCGTLPDPGEVAALEADHDPGKRARWVDRLLDRPGYADRFALLWSALLRNKRTLGTLSQPGTFAFHAWVREALAENRPYDAFVAALLTAAGDARVNPAVVWYRQAATAEDQADDAAQVFLGVRLGCARCHHHPSERWGQDDHEGFAAFFARVGRKAGPDPVTPLIYLRAGGGATDPRTGRPYAPRFLGADAPVSLDARSDPRAALAGWLRRPDNPYFARALVNRYWKLLFGRGLVEPEDDFRASNPPALPALLDELAGAFVGHGYDLKWLVRTLATSRVYGATSAPGVDDLQGLARFQPRRLPAEVLLDAIDTVCGTHEAFAGLPDGTRAVQLPDEGFDTPGRFLDTFGRPRRETACACERSAAPSLSQSLHLLNSPEVERKVSDPHGRAARWLADPRPDGQRVEELYRVALSRRPTADENAACLDHLARRRAEGRLRHGYEDLLWTLINSKEFGFVH